jgi:hypothetical protein
VELQLVSVAGIQPDVFLVSGIYLTLSFMATPSYFQLLCTTTLLVLYIVCLLCIIPSYAQLLRTISFLPHPSPSKFFSILITNYITIITVVTPLQYSTTHSSQRDIVKPISFSKVHNTHDIHLLLNPTEANVMGHLTGL